MSSLERSVRFSTNGNGTLTKRRRRSAAGIRFDHIVDVLNITIEPVDQRLLDLRFNVITDARLLEQLFPGCTVMWDRSPCWLHHYVRIANCEATDEGRFRRDPHKNRPMQRAAWKYSLMAWKCEANGHLAQAAPFYGAITARWFQEEERWVVLR